jgi:pimeloyl-ACP methyl ester carboxylesterase
MDEQEPQFLEVGGNGAAKLHRIAYRRVAAKVKDAVELIWLPGFLSDMASTKATAVAEWAGAQGFAMTRFDYSAHGRSGGTLLEATVGNWLEETVAVWNLMGQGPRIVIGSSMGGWIALLLARHLAAQGRSADLAGLVLIAPAFDMTEALMWAELPPEARAEIEAKGVTTVPSDYGEPYPITRRLIEEGRSHLIAPFDPGCPVRILQGMQDADVPWRHALALVDLLQGGDVELNLIKDAEHRQSRPQDLQRLIATVASLVSPTTHRPL